MSPRARVLASSSTSRKGTGVDIDDCVAVSNQLSRVLTVENIDYDRLRLRRASIAREEAADKRFAGSEII